MPRRFVLFLFIFLFIVTSSAQQWEYLGLPGQIITSIAVQSRDTIYAATPGAIFKTTTSGTSWDTIVRHTRVSDLKMHPRNVNVLYAAVSWSAWTVPPRILKTTNAGLTWFRVDTTINLPPVTGMEVIAIDPQYPETVYVGAAGIQGGDLYKTTNGGRNWAALGDTSRLRAGVVSIAIHPETTRIVYAGTHFNGDLLKTTDGGLTWMLTGLHDVDGVQDIVIDESDPQLMYAGVAYLNEGLQRSTNAGLTWTRATTGLPQQSNAWTLAVNAQNRVVYAGVANRADSGGVFKSTNLGRSWERMLGLPIGNNVMDLAFSRDLQQIYVGVTNYGIYRTDAITGIDYQGKNILMSAALDAYPNPFNAEVTIEYTVLVPGQTVVEIYDILGRKVHTLVNEKKLPGNHKVNFNAALLPSGVYVCRYFTTNGLVAVKRLVLIR